MSRRARWGILLLVAAGAFWFQADRWRATPRGDTEDRAALADAEGVDRPGREPKDGTPEDPPTLKGGGETAPRAGPHPLLPGRVVDGATGLGIEGVRLLCAHGNAGPREPHDARETMSDADGRFSIEVLEAGTWILIPFHEDYFHPFVGRLFGDTMVDKVAMDLRHEDLWKEARAKGLAFDITDMQKPREDIEIRLQQGPQITGRVLGPKNAPVAGAAVRVHSPYYGPWTTVGVGDVQGAFRDMILTHTDGSGRFSLSCFPAELRSIQLGAESTGLLGPWTDPLDLTDAGEVVLRLFEPAAVEGVVLREGNVPAPDAWVFADSSWPADRVKATTDAEGRFRLEGLPPAPVHLLARRAEEHKSAAHLDLEDLKPGEVRKGIKLVLEDHRLVGGVLRGPDGVPLAREYLVAYPTEEGEDPEDYLDGDWTDEHGRFLFEIESRGTFEIRVESADREDVLIRDVRAPRKGLVLVTTPTPSATFHVHVTDPAGKPVSSFRLKGWPGGNGGWRDGRGKDGRASFSVQGSPPYRFLVSRPRNEKGEKLPLAPYGWELAAVPSKPVEIRLARHAEFYGRILDLEDKPVPGVRLLIDEGSGERKVPVGADGRFRFTAADPTTREISEGRLILPEGYRDWTYVTILRSGVYEDIRVRGAGLPIKGRVVLQGAGSASLDDLGIELSWTSAENNEDDNGRDIATDAQGNFVLYALPDDAQVTVAVYPFSLATRGLVAVSPPVVVPAGTTDIILEVRLGAIISGHIAGPGVMGLDYLELRVGVLPWHGIVTRFNGQTSPTAESTSFRIAGLAEGRYRVALVDSQHNDRLLAWVDDVESGRDNVVLRLPRLSGAIEGTIAVKGLKNIEVIKVRVRHQDGSNYLIVTKASEDGRFRVDRLDPSGHYALQVAVRTEDALLVAVIPNVKPGQPIHLEPKPGLSIRGRVEGPREGKGVVAVVATAGGVSYFADFTRDDGTFVFTGLVEGGYEITVLGPGLVRRKSVNGVEAGAKGVVVHIK